MSKNIIANVEAGQKMSLSDVSVAETQWRKIYRDFEVFFEDIDLLIVRNATTAFRIEDGIPGQINGEKMENYMDASNSFGSYANRASSFSFHVDTIALVYLSGSSLSANGVETLNCWRFYNIRGHVFQKS